MHRTFLVGKCDKRRAVLILASHGVDVRTIAEALGLKESTVEAYIKRYGKKALNSPKQRAERPAPMVVSQMQAPLSNNQWIQLLRSKGQ